MAPSCPIQPPRNACNAADPAAGIAGVDAVGTHLLQCRVAGDVLALAFGHTHVTRPAALAASTYAGVKTSMPSYTAGSA